MYYDVNDTYTLKVKYTDSGGLQVPTKLNGKSSVSSTNQAGTLYCQHVPVAMMWSGDFQILSPPSGPIAPQY